jgi:uncharacterized protein (TIGR03067 family)
LEEQELEGLWTYATHEGGGVKRTQEEVAAMYQLVLLPGEHLPGWHGLWAVISYGYHGGTWTSAELKLSCRCVILGIDRGSEPPGPDFYLWAGGRFRVAPDRSPKEIDLEQFWRGSALPSYQMGLYRLDSDRLTLCLSESGKPRPSGFRSDEHPYQSLGELIRGDIRRTRCCT